MSGPDLGPGDMVEALEDGGGCLKVGSLYSVSDVLPEANCTCMNDERPWAFAHMGVVLGDGPNPHPAHGRSWCCYMFRPVSRRSSFEATLEALRITAFDLAPQPRTTVPA